MNIGSVNINFGKKNGILIEKRLENVEDIDISILTETWTIKKISLFLRWRAMKLSITK